MTVLSFAQMKAYWVQAGGPAAVATIAAAIGEAESGGRTDAVNPNDNNGTQSSYGWLQISNGTHSPPDPNWADPLVNARLGVAKYRAAGNAFSDWGTYVTGAYKQYLGGAANAPLVADPGQPGGLGGSTSSGSTPLSDLTSAVSQAGTLLGDAAKALDWFFHFFKPGQGWRIAFGAGSVIAFYGGVRSWQSASQSDEATAALPLAVLFFALSALAAFMTLRQWPSPGGQPIRPGAYAVDILEGKAPAAGAAPPSDVTAIEVGLGAILALWGASKVSQGLSGLGGLLGGLLTFLGLKGGGGSGPVEVPPIEAVP